MRLSSLFAARRRAAHCAASCSQRRAFRRLLAEQLEDRSLLTTYFVDDDAVGGDGLTWGTAFNDLQSALAAANTTGDEIWVAAGTYTPTTGADRTISFYLKSGVGLYGGFAGGETDLSQRDWSTNVTTLSGDIGASGDSGDNSYHVVRDPAFGADATLDGFTVTGGNANGQFYPDYVGGGIFNDYASSPLTLRNLILTGNYGEDGGGMANFYSSPTLTNFVFSGNSGIAGGGLLNYVSSPSLTDVTFNGNSASYGGGGVYNWNGSSPTLTNVTFSGNFGGFGGGGGFWNYLNSSPTLTNVTFSGNSTSGDGGGFRNAYLSAPVLTNVTFSGNSASYSGGGGILDYHGTLILHNSILWGNTSGAGSPQIQNGPEGVTTVTYSIVQGGWAGALDADPRFVRAPSPGTDGTWGTADDDYGDLRLQETSPAIDAGDNTAVPLDVADLDGDANTAEQTPLDLDLLPRFVDVPSVTDTGIGTPPLVDLGAFEFQVNLAPTALLLNGGLEAALLENSPSGTAVGTLATTDPDAGDTFTYSFATGDGDDHNADFTIDGDQLLIGVVPDYETQSAYTVRIRTTDAGGLWTEQAFTVQITDVAYDLKITKAGIPHPTVQAGSGPGNLKYNITVANVGLFSASNVQVSEVLTLPEGTTIVSISPGTGSSYAPNNAATGTWSIPLLTPGGSVQLHVVLTVGATTPNGATVSDTATITTAAENLTDTSVNSVTVSTTVAAIDYGDAPDSYGTLLVSGGPSHALGSGLVLGASADPEADGQPTALASGDDADAGGDDEDGVVLPATLIAWLGARIDVTASAAGKLDAWIDFNRNGVFEAAEQIATSLEVGAGLNSLTVNVPATAAAGQTMARFRLSSAGGLGPSGAAADGEVEDYAVTIARLAGGTATVVDDPAHPGDDLLLITGRSVNDAIAVQPASWPTGSVRVVLSGRTIGTYSMAAFDRIAVFGLGGDDSIVVDARLSTPATLYGDAGNDSLAGAAGADLLYGGTGYDTLSGGKGNDKLYGEAGNDTLNGGSGHDLLLGGDGNDKLYGGLGNDLLIGGLGVDWLYGQDNDDLLIGGRTTYDLNPAALDAILAQWASSAAFNARVAALQPVLNSSTVLNDYNAVDYLYGNGGRDWMLDFSLKDRLMDFNRNPTTGDRKN